MPGRILPSVKYANYFDLHRVRPVKMTRLGSGMLRQPRDIGQGRCLACLPRV